jgi:DNA-binding transcriptional regulator YhcF (GntR family)
VSFIQEGEKMQGWIKLHRKVKGHWLFTEKRTFTKFEAWIDLLLEVNHKDNKFMLGNDLTEVKRGQTITSIRQLCERWNWSNSKVTKFLKMLESDEMLKVKSDTKKTVITIDNYDIYQVQDTEETTEKRHVHDREATQKHTNKNDKNDKNDKKNNIRLEIENFRQRYSENQLKIIDNYLEMIRHTRVSAKISESVIIGMYREWDKYPAVCVEYGLKTHTENPIYHSKKENYTMGIIRNTSADDAVNKLNGENKKKRQLREEDFNLE